MIGSSVIETTHNIKTKRVVLLTVQSYCKTLDFVMFESWSETYLQWRNTLLVKERAKESQNVVNAMNTSLEWDVRPTVFYYLKHKIDDVC